RCLFSPRSLRVFPPLVLHLLPLAIVVPGQKLASNHFISPGKWRVVTPGTAITRPTENICGNSTCPKTPQNCLKEGRLKPFFANNVDIPFARARRLRPCPWKASTRSDPGRREMHLIE